MRAPNELNRPSVAMRRRHHSPQCVWICLLILVTLLDFSPTNASIRKSEGQGTRESQGTQESQSPLQLQPGKLIEREVTGTETQNYGIRLEAGQSVYVTLELNHDIRACVTAFDPSV